MVKVGARDPAALSELYDRYNRIAYSIIVRTLRDTQAADDVLQDVFLCIWEKGHMFDTACGVRPWVMTIARNRAIDHFRSLGKLRLHDLPAEQLDRVFSHATKEMYSHSLILVVLQKATARLSASQRHLLDLAYFKGFTQSEIAESLHQPLGTVKTRVRATLRLLRDQIGK